MSVLQSHTWTIFKHFPIVLVSAHFHQGSSLSKKNGRGGGQEEMWLLLRRGSSTHTRFNICTSTWWISSSCFLCSSKNLLSHDALSHTILVFRERMSLSVLVSLLSSADVRSGLPGMAATTLPSGPAQQSQKSLLLSSHLLRKWKWELATREAWDAHQKAASTLDVNSPLFAVASARIWLRYKGISAKQSSTWPVVSAQRVPVQMRN